MARLFRTAAEAERIHAEGHLRNLEGVGATRENLEAAIDGETFEYTAMYPPMLALAQAEKHRARTMFEFALKAESIHARLYEKALEAVAQGKDLNIEFGERPAACPLCGTKAERFLTVS